MIPDYNRYIQQYWRWLINNLIPIDMSDNVKIVDWHLTIMNMSDNIEDGWLTLNYLNLIDISDNVKIVGWLLTIIDMFDNIENGLLIFNYLNSIGISNNVKMVK